MPARKAKKPPVPPPGFMEEDYDVVKGIKFGLCVDVGDGPMEYAVSILLGFEGPRKNATLTLSPEMAADFCKRLMETASEVVGLNGGSAPPEPGNTAARLKAARRAREAKARKPK